MYKPGNTRCTISKCSAEPCLLFQGRGVAAKGPLVKVQRTNCQCGQPSLPTVHCTLCVVGEANGAPISTDPVKLNQGSNYRHDVFYILCPDRINICVLTLLN